MSIHRLTPDEIRKAQDLVGRIQGISSCQISAGDSGEITEVHVVATADKSPKFIARDVESCLKAAMGVDVDHRKIGVVVVESDETARPPEPTIEPRPVRVTAGDAVVEFPLEEYASRFVFHSVNLFISQRSVRAEVELSRESVTAFGSAQNDRPIRSSFEVVAEATLRAISEYLDETLRLCLVGLRRVSVDDVDMIVVIVDRVSGRDRKCLVGASVVTGNENQTVVFATLDAVNRVLGKLDFKSAVEYKIK
jgi:hypothetical protein